MNEANVSLRNASATDSAIDNIYSNSNSTNNNNNISEEHQQKAAATNISNEPMTTMGRLATQRVTN